jgi:hypothetical protein
VRPFHVRNLLPILLTVLLAGCAHRPTALPHNPEGHIRALAEEIQIMEVTLREYRRRYPDMLTGSEQAMRAARDAYPESQRARDTQTVIQLLERRKAALSAELSEVNKGRILY